MQPDPDLAAVRDKDALDKLVGSDRAPFVKFWAEVDALLAKLDKDKPAKDGVK